jgi:hypothetical protein
MIYFIQTAWTAALSTIIDGLPPLKTVNYPESLGIDRAALSRPRYHL